MVDGRNRTTEQVTVENSKKMKRERKERGKKRKNREMGRLWKREEKRKARKRKRKIAGYKERKRKGDMIRPHSKPMFQTKVRTTLMKLKFSMLLTSSIFSVFIWEYCTPFLE